MNENWLVGLWQLWKFVACAVFGRVFGSWTPVLPGLSHVGARITIGHCLKTNFNGEWTSPFGVVGCGGMYNSCQCLPTTLGLVLMWGACITLAHCLQDAGVL